MKLTKKIPAKGSKGSAPAGNARGRLKEAAAALSAETAAEAEKTKAEIKDEMQPKRDAAAKEKNAAAESKAEAQPKGDAAAKEKNAAAESQAEAQQKNDGATRKSFAERKRNVAGLTEERVALERLSVKLACVVFGVAAVVLLWPVAWSWLSPFIVAIPLAALLQPITLFFKKKLKLKHTAASMVPVLLMLGLLLGLFYWLLSFGIGQLVGALNNSGTFINDTVTGIRNGVETLLAKATDLSPDMESWLRSALNDLIAQLTDWGTEFAGKAVALTLNFATSLPNAMIYICFLLLGLFFIAKEYPEIRSYLPGGKKHKQDSNATQLTHSAIHSLIGYLRVQLIFGVVTGVICGIYLSCFHYKYPVVMGVIAGVMELIPMIGSGFLFIVWGVAALLTGATATGIQLLALTGGLQLIRRLVEPKIMSTSIGISPLLSLMGMFVGMQLGGVLGLILGPVAIAVLYSAIRGRYFESMRQDVLCLARYLKNRWS